MRVRGRIEAVIVGAGLAGLAALEELDRAGARCICLEARDRIGGRVFTMHDPLSPVPVELGAEFVHGRAPQIFDIVRSHQLTVYEVGGSAVHVRHGKVQHGVDGWELVDEVMTDMQRAAKGGGDQSFSGFLERSKHADAAKQLAASYVEGFNAARKELISIKSLAQDSKAADEIDGDCSFRLGNGYDSLPVHMMASLRDVSGTVKLNCEVERIEWRSHKAVVSFRSALTGQGESIEARRVILTVPLGVLLCGGIAFDPEPMQALEAARALKFGQVVRVVLRFKEAFWEEKEEFANAGFLLSDQPVFPTWWTTLPIRSPIITGWSAGPHADGLRGKSKPEIIEHALADLGKITGLRVERLHRLLLTAYFHDWQGDPFARGAYSYVPVGAVGAREKLARPIESTLYFAGEATETQGHSATVHGAIASGRRVAREILDQG